MGGEGGGGSGGDLTTLIGTLQMYYVKNSPGVRVGNCRRISFQLEYLDKIVGVEIKALQNIRRSVFFYGYWERVHSRTSKFDHLS